MSSAPIFPGHPKVSLFLDNYINHQPGQPLPDPPDPDLLDGFIKGLNSCKRNADKRAESAREALRVGQEGLNKARRKLDKQHASAAGSSVSAVAGGSGTSSSGNNKASHNMDDVKRLKNKDKTRRTSFGLADDHVRLGHGHSKAKSPVRNTTPGVKRELSASPAPSDASFMTTGPDSGRHAGTPLTGSSSSIHKKKKRKVVHDPSPDAPLASTVGTQYNKSQGTRMVSPSLEGGSERGHSISVRGERESSIRSSRMGSPLAPSMPPPKTDGMTRPPVQPNSQSASGSAPKIKLKINQNKIQGYDSTPQRFVNPNMSWSLGAPVASSSSATSAVRSLLPLRPAIPAPTPPHPSRQRDVNQDFSVVKNVAQTVQWGTFWSGIETYIRDVGEEDVAMLTFRPDDRGIFEVPALGRHYQDIWDEEDASLPFGGGSSQAANQAWATSAAMSQGAMQRDRERDGLGNRIGKASRRVVGRNLTEMDLKDERKGPGLLEERIVAGLLERPSHGHSPTDLAVNGTAEHLVVKREPDLDTTESSEDPPDGVPDGRDLYSDTTTDVRGKQRDLEATTWPIPAHRIDNDDHQASLDQQSLTVGETEEGVKRELRHLGLLDSNEEVDWTRKEDDEVATALRQCQRALKSQMTTNNARKQRLTELVKDRLAYAGYKKTLDGLEKVIESAWLKRVNRKMKKSKHQHANNHSGSEPPRQALSEQVKTALDARARWIEVVGSTMTSPEAEARYTGLPEKSIYQGVETGKEDVAGRRWYAQTAAVEP